MCIQHVSYVTAIAYNYCSVGLCGLGLYFSNLLNNLAISFFKNSTKYVLLLNDLEGKINYSSIDHSNT